MHVSKFRVVFAMLMLYLLGLFVAAQAVPTPLVVRRVPWGELLPASRPTAKGLAPPPGEKVGDIWSNCSKPDDPVTLNSLSVYPDPPKKGRVFTVDANVTLDEEVTGGEAQVKIYYGIFEVVNKTYNICEILEDHGKSCPLEKGIHIVQASQEISHNALSGLYSGSITVVDQNGKELVCISLYFNL